MILKNRTMRYETELTWVRELRQDLLIQYHQEGS